MDDLDVRPRINRWTKARRDLIFGPGLAECLVQPHFVVSGSGIDQAIPGMPGINRQSKDVLIETISRDISLGLSAHMIFPVMSESEKDDEGTKAADDGMPLQSVVRDLKEKFGDEILLMTDACLCTSTDHGHCGLLEGKNIVNDPSVETLVGISLSHARAGTDYVCLSDMMDGRVLSVRRALEKEGFNSTGIMSYSVKYASSFYGPFRDAASSAPSFGDRSSHQMDVRSDYREAILEAKTDVEEGCDIAMVKPGLPYLDVLKEVSSSIERPVAVYNVSGEYSMVMGYANDSIQRKRVVLEILGSFIRAGADIIVSYHSREAIREGWV